VTKRSTDLAHINMTSGVSVFTGEPFVEVVATDESGNRMRGQLTPADVRAHAMAYLEAAEAAETDAFIVTWLKETVGLEEQQALRALAAFREMRGQ
jgi:hypothetical protein